MFKVDKYLKLTKLPSVMVVRHKGRGGNKEVNKCSQDCPHSKPETVNCTTYDCIRRKKIQVVEPPTESPTHPFLKAAPPSNPKLWRSIFFFVCLPTIIGLYFHVIIGEKEVKRPKYVEFSYLRIRNKGYAWDPVKTLFHNPRNNALPGGYEVEVPEDEEYDPFEGYPY